MMWTRRHRAHEIAIRRLMSTMAIPLEFFAAYEPWAQTGTDRPKSEGVRRLGKPTHPGPISATRMAAVAKRMTPCGPEQRHNAARAGGTRRTRSLDRWGSPPAGGPTYSSG